MQKAKLLIFLILSLTSLRAHAHEPAEGKIWATVQSSTYRTIPRHKLVDDQSPYLVGGGIVAEGDFDTNGGVEIAMLYLDKVYLRQRGQEYTSEQIKRMYITTGYRHWFNRGISTALSFYSAYSMGDVKTRHAEAPSDEDLTTTASAITEYGMDLSLQWEFWGNDEMAAVLDGRYSYAITHKSREDADVYALALGFKYLVPKRR